MSVSTQALPAPDPHPVGEDIAAFLPRLRAAGQACRDGDGALRLLRRQRLALLHQAVDFGVSQRAVARALGLTQSRVVRLLMDDPNAD